MILNLDQWHLGYASLLRDCRGPSSPGDDDGGGAGGGLPPTVGRALLLVHPDTDAMATARILSYMLRADGVPYQMRPCMGWSRLTKVLARVGVISKGNDEEEADGDDENGEGNDNGNDGGEADADIRAVVLMNMGANRNLARLFRSRERDLTQPDSYDGAPRAGVKCYVFDCHRPYHLANVHAGKDVVLFNDRELEEDEVPSDGDNLSGDESSSDEESDSDEEDGGEGGGEGGPAGDDDEGEAEFELGDGLGEERFEESDPEEDNDGDDNDDNDGDSTSSGREAKRRRTDRGEDDGLRDSDDEDGPDSNEGKKLGGSGAAGLDTTAATADLTADETLDPSQTQEGEGTTTNTAEPALSFRELHRRRRNRIRLHYSAGSYHASPSSWAAYTLSRQLRFGDTPDLLWLACVGVTDAYLHGRLDVAGYSALAVDLRRHVGRLFPNELVDRAGRAVYAEELDGSSSSSGAATQVGLSENGRVLVQSELRFMLLRHTSLWDSMVHSDFVASRLQVWRGEGRARLMELLAKMGFPLDSCGQPWAFAGQALRRRLRERIDEHAEEYGLGNCSYTGFVRVTGYKSLLSASDMSHAVTALLECSTEAMNGGSSPSAPGDGDMTEEDREDLEMVRNFNNALDAMNPNGSSSSVVPSSLAATAGGAVEGGDLTNLVNGGDMAGSTGLGAGIRLAMTLQKQIMNTARGLVERNAITRLSHFRYAYLHCTSRGGGGGGASGPGARVVTPETGPGGDESGRFHVFSRPLVLTRLAQFLMDVHRENGKWTGPRSRPLVLLAEKPRSDTYMVVGYEQPEDAGSVVRNRFGQNFEMAARSMRGTFWFDSFDSNVVEVGAGDVQRFIEQLHYMMESV